MTYTNNAPADASLAGPRGRVILSLFLLSLATSASASTLFVAVNGSDSNTCTTASAPCRSFNAAYAKATLGDTVEVAAGTYPEQNILYNASKAGAASDMPDVIFRPAAGAAVIINGNLNFGSSRMQGGASHVTVQDITLNDGVWIPGCGVPDGTPCPADKDSPGNDITFKNLRVKGLYAFTCSSCSNVNVIGGTWGPDTYGCQAGMGSAHPEIQSAYKQVKRANHILIDGAVWKNFARCSTSDHTECLQVEPADDLTIRNSTFKNCDTMSVNIANDLANSNSAAGYRAPNNILIENNFFDTAKDSTGGPTYYALNIRECTNCIVRYNSWSQAPRMPTGEVSKNNLFLGNVGPMSQAACGITGVTYSHNVWEGASCSSTDKNVSDVGFVNESAVDLHLKSTSPARGAGDPNNSPSTDIDGEARPAGGPVDAGADQFAGSLVTLNPPSNLTVVVR